MFCKKSVKLVCQRRYVNHLYLRKYTNVLCKEGIGGSVDPQWSYTVAGVLYYMTIHLRLVKSLCRQKKHDYGDEV